MLALMRLTQCDSLCSLGFLSLHWASQDWSLEGKASVSQWTSYSSHLHRRCWSCGWLWQMYDSWWDQRHQVVKLGAIKLNTKWRLDKCYLLSATIGRQSNPLWSLSVEEQPTGPSASSCVWNWSKFSTASPSSSRSKILPIVRVSFRAPELRDSSATWLGVSAFSVSSC